MEKVRIGAIGAGYWGPNLIRNFNEIPGSELVAVADLKQERLNPLRERYPSVTLTQNYKDLFEMNLDGVVIATPPFTHYEVAKDCLEHGLSVLVEKPLTLNTKDAASLIQIAAERNLKVMVGHTFEYHAAVHALKKIIDSGEIGNIYYIDAVRTNLGLFQPRLDAMWDLAPHDISILLHLLGDMPESVNVNGSACIWENTYDVTYMHLTFKNGVHAHIRNSWLDPQKVRRITIVGSKKMIVYDDIETLEKIKIYDRGVDALPYTQTFGDFQMSYRYGDIVIPNVPVKEPLRVQCEEFVGCIMNDRQPRSNGESGLRVIKVLEAATRSLDNHGNEEFVDGRPSFVSDTVENIAQN